VTLVSAPLAAWYYGVPVGTIHYWASADRWVKYGSRRNRQYEMIQVQASYLRRRVPPEVLDKLTCGQARFTKMAESRQLAVECSTTLAQCARRTP
jgi:hypothetical protein